MPWSLWHVPGMTVCRGTWPMPHSGVVAAPAYRAMCANARTSLFDELRLRPSSAFRGVIEEEFEMKHTLGFAVSVAVASLIGLSACAGMSDRDRSTAIGAGVGAVGGAVLTGGSGIGTVGGAAVGGVIGNETGKR
jgi:osmotically inducible lipoprotein OsmB